MKAIKDPNPPVPFIPVHLVLETQEEVDKVYALFNHWRITGAVDLPNAWKDLSPYKSNESVKWYVRICKAL